MRRKTSVTVAVILILILAISSFLLIPTIKKQLYPREFSDHVSHYSAEYEVPESLVYAVILNESSFDPEAVSHVGAVGLMQLMPETYDWISDKLGETVTADYRNDPETSIRYGTYYLSYLYQRFGDWQTAVAAYNAGPNRVSEWLKDERYSDDGKTLKAIPYNETKNHVKKVFDSKKQYEQIYYENGED